MNVPKMWNLTLFLLTLFGKGLLLKGESTTTKGVVVDPSLGTLQVAQVLFRHGARAIDKTYPGDPYADQSFWPRGYSQLTCIGETQGYELGRYLRSRYEAFINDSYIPKEIHVQSSDLDRTIQTASAVLAGFYPPNPFIPENNQDCRLIQWKNVPVHSTPAYLDNILRQKAECPRYTWLQDDFHQNSKVIKDIVKNNWDLLIYFAENTALDISRTSDFSEYYDTLVVENYFNLTLPEWTKKIYGTEEAIALGTFYFESLTYTDEMKRLRVGPLINKLISNFNEGLNVSTIVQDSKIIPRKLYLMSGHDHTLAGLLDTLDLYDSGTRPTFVSAIFIELYGEDEEPFQDLNVQISYRNGNTERILKVMELQKCGVPCKYSKFLEILNPFRPQDWIAECQSIPGAFSTLTEGVVWGTVGLSVAVVLVITCLLLRSFRKRQKNAYSAL